MGCNKWLIMISHSPKHPVFGQFSEVHLLATRPAAELNLLREVCPACRIAAGPCFVCKPSLAVLHVSFI
ncbi:hypothetical protein PspLS_03762 [Pyricularia sp. CBS 133598]|nr:hypothetical protein PspLS_03762 [Pyricularia sp. CBS 133598]